MLSLTLIFRNFHLAAVIVMMSSQADPLDAELISLTMTAVSHFREIFALSQ